MDRNGLGLKKSVTDSIKMEEEANKNKMIVSRSDKDRARPSSAGHNILYVTHQIEYEFQVHSQIFSKRIERGFKETLNAPEYKLAEDVDQIRDSVNSVVAENFRSSNTATNTSECSCSWANEGTEENLSI